MKKLLLILGFILFVQTNEIFAQTIELPSKMYLCENSSLDLDGTVTNTTDSGITYQWYFSIYPSAAESPENLIDGATNAVLSINEMTDDFGYYKVVATMTNTDVLYGVVRVVGQTTIIDYEIVECVEFYYTYEFWNNQSALYLLSNATYAYYLDYDEAIAGSGISVVEEFQEINGYQYQSIYLRIEENNGACAEVFTIFVDQFQQPLYAYNVSNMGSCSPEPTSNVFDLTVNDDQILSGQQAVVNYFVNYSDAFDLQNPIATPSSYTAISPNQTIYARVFDPSNQNFFCQIDFSITQFQLLSISEPTPNTEVDYIVCDTSSGSSNDGIGAFDLPSRNALVLSGLSTFQYNISYYNTIVDAENTTNSIASPNTYIASDGVVYVRVESNANSDCVQISQLNLFVQDACDDISVNLLSYWSAPRPGFTYRNMLIIKNNGESTVSSGTVEFTNDALVTYSGATGLNAGNTITPTANGFTLDFIDLLPGESETININLLVSVSADLGEIVTNLAEYTTSTNDVVVENNTSTLSEIIIGSYDPNDIVESHGPEIVHASFTEDDYLYYTIRFQNVGTASAINVTIDNSLDDKLDKTTFQMLSASHSYGFERDFDNLTWQFSNINLPDETADEPNSHGYVYYRIKPLAGYSVGDIVPNTAGIVFDFNAPVITNTFDTEFVDVLGIDDYSLNTQFLLTPNPSKEVVNLKFKSEQSNVDVAIFDLQGKMILTDNVQQTLSIQLNISSLESGIYFVKVNDHNGQSGFKKLIKE